MSFSTAEFTRPADTSAYAIGDVISNDTSAGLAMNFGSAGRNITRITVLKSTNAVNLTMSLALFLADPGTVNDNAALPLTYANRATYLGTYAMGTPVVVGSIANADLVLTQPLPTNAGSLYGVLVATAAVAAANAEQFSVRLQFS